MSLYPLQPNTKYWTKRGLIHTTDWFIEGKLLIAYTEVDKRSTWLLDAVTGIPTLLDEGFKPVDFWRPCNSKHAA